MLVSVVGGAVLSPIGSPAYALGYATGPYFLGKVA